MTDSERALQVLIDGRIDYSVNAHAPVYTMEDCFTVQTLPKGAQMPKNVFLCNRQKTEFYLMLLEPFVPFRTAEVSKLLGVSRLSFAPPEALAELLHLSPGAVSPLALCFDRDKTIRLIVDDRLKAHPFLCFHPLLNTATVTIQTEDFFSRYLPLIGHEPTFVHLAEVSA